MTPDEQERMYSLCKEIANEQDSKKLNELVTALNDLLAGNGLGLSTTQRTRQIESQRTNPPAGQ